MQLNGVIFVNKAKAIRFDMRTIFTFLLITFVSLGSFAQNTSSSAKKNSSFSSGISTEQQSFSIGNVYPNPVKDFVTVEIQSKISGAVQISIYNILGTEVKKWDSNNLHQGDQKLKVDLSFLKSGVYILRISGSGQICSHVLKKN
ncbi:MAG: T9SS type A sorting domain-containing protein [Bacteroidota bacterium]|nr:T9SS type A sorting domain-containing protein [Bacteroidota bacterium]